MKKLCVAAVVVVLSATSFLGASQPTNFDQFLFAVIHGDVNQVQRLIDQGQDVNAKDSNGFTALRAAILNDRVAIVQMLLDKGASANTVYPVDGLAPLHITRDKNIALMLFEYGADITMKTPQGQTAFDQASAIAVLNNSEKIKDLVSVLQAMQTGGLTPTHAAAMRGSVAGVQRLISIANNADIAQGGSINLSLGTQLQVGPTAGKIINATRADGITPLLDAVNCGNAEVVKLLLDYPDVQIDARMQPTDFTSLHIAAESGNIEIMTMLVNRGADIEAVGDDSVNRVAPLHLAVAGGKIDAVKYLLAQGANPHILTADDQTPYDLALHEKRPDIAKLFVIDLQDIQAWYTSRSSSKAADVSKAVQAVYARYGKIFVPYVDGGMNSLFGDPAPDESKKLVITFVVNGEKQTMPDADEQDEVVYPLGGQLPPVQEVANEIRAALTHPQAVDSNLRVTAAWYGLDGNQNNIWVTGRMQAVLARFGNFIMVPANMNNFFGFDPIPGQKKNFALQVVNNGKVVDMRAPEGQKFVYPIPTTGGATYQATVYKHVWNDAWKIPAAGKGVITFTANAANDVILGFSPAAQTQSNSYELVLGGGGNTMCSLRSKPFGSNKSFAQIASNKNVLPTPGLDTDYWVLIDSSKNRIAAGTGKIVGANVMIDGSFDPAVANLQYVSFTNWNNPFLYKNISFSEWRGGQ